MLAVVLLLSIGPKLLAVGCQCASRCSACWWPGEAVQLLLAAVLSSTGWAQLQQVFSTHVPRRLPLWLLVYQSRQPVGMPVRSACTRPAAIATA